MHCYPWELDTLMVLLLKQYISQSLARNRAEFLYLQQCLYYVSPDHNSGGPELASSPLASILRLLKFTFHSTPMIIINR